MVLRILKFSYLSLLTLSHPTLTYLTKPFLELSWGPSIKYIMLFLANFDPPPPVTLCHTSWDPQSMSHISDPPPFLVGLVQKTRTKTLFTNCSRGFFKGPLVWKVLSGMAFVCSPSVRIHLLQQKVKHRFKFQVSYA